MKTDAKRESEPRKNRNSSVPIRQDGIGTRISTLVNEVGGMKKATHICGRRDDAIRRWSKQEGRGAPFVALAQLAEEAGASLDWLATGEGPKYRAESGAETGLKAASPGDQGDSGYEEEGCETCGAGRAGPAPMPSLEVFSNMAAIIKVLAEIFSQDEIIAMDIDDLTNRLQMGYYMVKDARTR